MPEYWSYESHVGKLKSWKKVKVMKKSWSHEKKFKSKKKIEVIKKKVEVVKKRLKSWKKWKSWKKNLWEIRGGTNLAP